MIPRAWRRRSSRCSGIRLGAGRWPQLPGHGTLRSSQPSEWSRRGRLSPTASSPVASTPAAALAAARRRSAAALAVAAIAAAAGAAVFLRDRPPPLGQVVAAGVAMVIVLGLTLVRLETAVFLGALL